MDEGQEKKRRYFVSLRERGVITVPAALRRRYGLDEPGVQVELVERDDGVFEVRPHRAVPAKAEER